MMRFRETSRLAGSVVEWGKEEGGVGLLRVALFAGVFVFSASLSAGAGSTGYWGGELGIGSPQRLSNVIGDYSAGRSGNSQLAWRILSTEAWLQRRRVHVTGEL